MNVQCHRFRFGDWLPRPIRAIAADPFSCMVAVGREDGDVEITNSANRWVVQSRIPGYADFQLQSLVWSNIQEEAGRLFGVSLRGFIFEIDIATLRTKHIRDSYGGSAWCLAASPRSTTLAAGCEDGTVRLFRYDGGQLEFARLFPSVSCRVLCVSFHPREERVFMGCADGTIRCVEESTGRGIFRMVGEIFRGLPSYIYSMIVLKDSTVVTGDSRGLVQFWDGEMGTLICGIHQHNNEIKALAASPDESQIFAAGVDSKVTLMKRVADSQQAGGGDAGGGGGGGGNNASDKRRQAADAQWVYASAHRPHSHDVLALAICQVPTNRNNMSTTSSSSSSSTSSSSSSSSPVTSILVSGGLDCKLCSYSVDDFIKSRPSWIFPVPSRGLVQHTRSHSLISVRHRNRIDLWKLSCQGLPDASACIENGKAGNDGQVTNNNNNNDDNVDDDNDDAEQRLSKSAKKKARGGNKRKDDVASAEDVTPPTPAPAPTPAPPVVNKDGGCILLAQMQMKGDENIHCSALSLDGRYLAYSSTAGTRLRAFEEKNVKDRKKKNVGVDVDTSSLTMRTLVLPAEASGFCHALTFSNDCHKLAAVTDKGQLVMMDLSQEGEVSAKVWHVFDHKDNVNLHQKNQATTATTTSTAIALTNDASSASFTRKSVYTGLDHVCTNLIFSPDDQYLVVMDANRGVYVYEVDRLRLHWRLPDCPAPVTAAAFHPLSPTSLVITLANNAFLIFDVELLQLSPWSVENHEKTALALSGVAGPIEGIAFNPASSTAFVLFGQGFCVFVDIDSPVPTVPHKVHDVCKASTQDELQRLGDADSTGTSVTMKRKLNKRDKRKRRDSEGGGDTSNFSIITRYRCIIHMSILQQPQPQPQQSGMKKKLPQLIVVENPWIRVTEELPQVIERKRYGT